MCLTARGTEKTAHTVDELMAAVDATETERAFFASRVRRFNPGAATTATREAMRRQVVEASTAFTTYGDYAQTRPRDR